MREKVYKVIIKSSKEFGRSLTMAFGVVDEIVEFGFPSLGVTSQDDLEKLKKVLEENGVKFSVEE